MKKLRQLCSQGHTLIGGQLVLTLRRQAPWLQVPGICQPTGHLPAVPLTIFQGCWLPLPHLKWSLLGKTAGWHGEHVLILARTRILLLYFVFSCLIISDWGNFLVPLSVNIFHNLSSSFEVPFRHPEHIHLVGKRRALSTHLWLSWITQILHFVFLLVASTKTDFSRQHSLL